MWQDDEAPLSWVAGGVEGEGLGGEVSTDNAC